MILLKDARHEVNDVIDVFDRAIAHQRRIRVLKFSIVGSGDNLSSPQTPLPNCKGGEGLVDIERFLGLADLACLTSCIHGVWARDL